MAKGKYREWITPDGLTRLEGWARSGLTDQQIAEKIGISRGTIYQWMLDYPDIADAIKRGKAPVDDEVEKAMLKSALGYEWEEIITDIIEFPGGEQRKHVRKIKHYNSPVTTAQIFWLKNRRPERWRDRQEVTGSINMQGAGDALRQAFESMGKELQND